MTEPVRVVVAEDHPMFRDGLRNLLAATDTITCVADVGTGEEAIEACAEHQPDVVLMDLQLPGINGIEATRRIITDSPHVCVLVLTMFDDDESVFAAMRAGAKGYLLKGAAREEITRAVIGVANGEAIFGPGVAWRVLAYFTAGPAIAEPFPQLTEREREILDLIARGLSNPDIGRALVISEKTVRNHVSNIFNKLAVADRAQAIVRAREAGMGHPGG